MKNWLTIPLIFASCSIICQNIYLPIDKSSNIGLDTLESGKVVIWFDVYGARDVKRKNEQLISVKESNHLLREQKFVLQSMLDSCEKQKANVEYVRDTVINTVRVVDESYKKLIKENELQRRRAIHWENKNKSKIWVIISLIGATIIGFAT